ncbi:MAG: NAD-dependent epimerase/dehydratase family protein [Elusimicrobia bacterium]|nr:NAD-dependent epimerase/dehydratase family protein [Elusimicrobiota bacterium]
MKVLVTGGGGFVGGAVARVLRRHGHEVRSLSRREHPELAQHGVGEVPGDLLDFDSVRAACRGADAVVHCAAKVGLWGPLEEFHKANVTGTGNVLRACQELGIRKLVYTSSPSVVFDGRDVEGWDESAPYSRSFDSFYSRTKATAEEMVLSSNTASFATVAIRPHLVWGPGEDKLVSRLLAKARNGELRRIGTLNKKVDSTYVDDAAEAHRLALDRLEPRSPVAGRAYFISAGEPRPVWDVVNDILAAAGLPPVTAAVSSLAARLAAWGYETFYAAAGKAEEPPLTRFLVQQLTTAHWFDISAARRDLGYSPQVPFEAALERLRVWLAQKSERSEG